MKKVEYHLNDYVLNEDNKVCRVIGTKLEPVVDYTEEFFQMLTIVWREDKDGHSVMHIDEVSANRVCGWSFNMSVLSVIGFRKGESLSTVVYRDIDTKRSIVIDRTDGSIYAFFSSRHIMLDLVRADNVHEIQHAFETVGIEFPNLSGWLFNENAKRKPPIRLHGVPPVRPHGL